MSGSPKAAPDRFAGKIVLIGPYAPGLQDDYLTAADHAMPMYGVEYQANALQVLLRGGFKREVKDGIQFVILFLVLLAGIAGFWKRPVWTASGILLAVSAAYLALCRRMYNRGLVLHVLWIPAGMTVLYVGCLAFNYIQAAVEKRRVTKTFKRYVAPEIVNEILKEGTAGLELGEN